MQAVRIRQMQLLRQIACVTVLYLLQGASCIRDALGSRRQNLVKYHCNAYFETANVTPQSPSRRHTTSQTRLPLPYNGYVIV
jgi:hypothetical protein